MRKAFCLIVALSALLGPASTALAQGYPSSTAASQYSLYPYPTHPVHYYCGKSLVYACDAASMSLSTNYCPWLRGEHSRDCWVTYYEVSLLNPFGGGRYCRMHDWVRLEPDYSLSWHKDSDSCYG